MLLESPGVSKAKLLMLKSAIRVLINKFGIHIINEIIAEIFFEESNATMNYFYDDLSESYDEINRKIRFQNIKSK